MQLDQGATKITRRATDNTAALNAFMAAKREIDGMLARIKTLSDDHFETDPGGIHWGDVGTLNHYCSVLPDAALPSALTAEWQEVEANADTPYPSYARMLSQMGTPGADSPVSWTVDFAARREKAREEMKPLLDQARQLKDEVVDLKEDLKRLKKGKAAGEDIDALTIKIVEAEKAYRDLETQAANIDAAVFDLKAVNPNVVAQVDNRTPTEIIESNNAQGRIVSDALARLSALVAEDLAAQLSAESVE